MPKAPLIYAGIMLTVLAWGSYGPLLHRGQANLDGARLKPLMCVGLAYLIVAVILPAAYLGMKGQLAGQWTSQGLIWSTAAGICGTLGAFGIILAMSHGGKPPLVMPLVFGCAPVMTVAVTMFLQKVPLRNIQLPFVLGLLLVSIGAALVLMYQPKSAGHGSKPAEQVAEEDVH